MRIEHVIQLLANDGFWSLSTLTENKSISVVIKNKKKAKMSDPISIIIVTISIAVISELMPLLPGKYNGILQGILEICRSGLKKKSNHHATSQDT